MIRTYLSSLLYSFYHGCRPWIFYNYSNVGLLKAWRISVSTYLCWCVSFYRQITRARIKWLTWNSAVRNQCPRILHKMDIWEMSTWKFIPPLCAMQFWNGSFSYQKIKHWNFEVGNSKQTGIWPFWHFSK